MLLLDSIWPIRNLIFCRIINECYKKVRDHAKRPKIFGMTASPVDAKVDVVVAARYAYSLSSPF
jgi:hypothetical protein